jgi:DNA-binding CsgD family transcriptional regulator
MSAVLSSKTTYFKFSVEYPEFIVSRNGVLKGFNKHAEDLLQNGEILIISENYRLNPIQSANQILWKRCFDLIQKGIDKVSLALRNQNKVYACQISTRADCLLSIHFETQVCFNAEALKSFSVVYSLTPAEAEILGLLCSGLRPIGISKRLTRSDATVRSHIRSLLNKTELHSMQELMITLARMPQHTLDFSQIHGEYGANSKKPEVPRWQAAKLGAEFPTSTAAGIV